MSEKYIPAVELKDHEGNNLIVYNTADLRSESARHQARIKKHVPLYTRKF